MSVELLEIGRFAAVSGLSIPALRHYDEVGILKPQVVDPRTSYRRYHPDQLPDARMICSLRGVDLPIEEIRALITAREETTTREILVRHQGRLAERAERLDRMITTSYAYVDRGSRCRHGTGPAWYRSWSARPTTIDQSGSTPRCSA